MILADVVGRIWSDRHVPALKGQRMVVVAAVADGTLHVALDLVDVEAGNRVIVATDEAVQATSTCNAADAAVVARVAGHDPLPDADTNGSP